jgi:DNA-binding NarL/FixJ family response regulator
MFANERNTMVIRLLIVDDHRAIRESMRALADAAGIAIAGEATVSGATAMAQQHRIDVVVLGINSSRDRGLDALSRLKKRCPDLPILIYAFDDSPFAVAQAHKRGANGYLVKGRDEQVLIEAIQDAVPNEELRNVIDQRTSPRLRAASAAPGHLPVFDDPRADRFCRTRPPCGTSAVTGTAVSCRWREWD